MNSKNLYEAFSYVDDKYLDLVDTLQKEQTKMKPNKEHPSLRRIITLAMAAALCASILGITAYATKLFGILDMDVVLEENPTVEVISINGYQGSAEYNAAVEWQNYLDKSIADGTNEMPRNQETDIYWYYNAFSQEAKDTLDALLDKYDLQMYQERQYVVGQKELYETVGAFNFLPESAGLTEITPSGHVIDKTSIYSYVDSADLPNGKNIPYDIFRLKKGTFIYTGFLVGDVSKFEEWTYTTKDGVSVVLCLNETKSLMMADLGNSFVLLNIRCGSSNDDPNRSSYGRDALTKADLETFADMFDFAKLKALG